MDTPRITDWHAHVYFDAASRNAAWALRERIEKAFPIEMGRFHEKPVGPHPRFSYQVAFRNDLLAPLLSWLTLNRGESGDNAIGPQLFDALGLIRTDELLEERPGLSGKFPEKNILFIRKNVCLFCQWLTDSPCNEWCG